MCHNTARYPQHTNHKIKKITFPMYYLRCIYIVWLSVHIFQQGKSYGLQKSDGTAVSSIWILSSSWHDILYWFRYRCYHCCRGLALLSGGFITLLEPFVQKTVNSLNLGSLQYRLFMNLEIFLQNSTSMWAVLLWSFEITDIEK